MPAFKYSRTSNYLKELNMKLIIAYIQPEKLTDVKQALYKAEIYKMSITNSLGCGQQKGYHETYRGVDIEVNLLQKMRIEIAVNETFVKPAIEAITTGARSGNIGDGKIFVMDIIDCIRIRTGETGSEAIG
jgi:nitrogen regulatory protein P-II 1